MLIRLGLLVLCLMVPGSLVAFEVTVRGTVVNSLREPLAGVRIEAVAPPKSQRPVPGAAEDFTDATVSGDATSGEDGTYSFQLKVSLPEGKTFPVRRSFERGPDGRQEVLVRYSIVQLKFTDPSERYHELTIAELTLSETEASYVRVDRLQPITRIRARFVFEDGEPAAHIQIRHPLGHLDPRQRRRHDWSTDAEGVFDAVNAFVEGPIAILDVHQTWDVAPSADGDADSDSDHDGRFVVKPGENDFGEVRLIRRCRITLTAVADDTGEPVEVSVYATDQDGRSIHVGARPRFPDTPGPRVINTLPAGTWDIAVSPANSQAGYWPKLLPGVVVVSGESIQLPEVRLDPHLELVVRARNESGEVVQISSGIAYLLEGVVPPTGTARSPLSNADGRYYASGWPRAGVFVWRPVSRGTWRFFIEANGYAPARFDVELPHDGTVEVTLNQGGTVNVRGESPAGRAELPRAMWLVRTDSPLFPAMEEAFASENHFRAPNSPSARQGLHRIVGPMMRDADAGHTFTHIEPGMYVVFFVSETDSYIRSEEFQVRAGELERVVVTLPTRTMTIHVTEGGKPLAGVVLCLVRTSMDSWNDKPTTLTTNGAGVATMESSENQRFYVFLDYEYEFLYADYHRAQRARQFFREREASMSLRQDTELRIDTAPPEGVWTTIRPTVHEAWTVRSISLAPMGEDETSASRVLFRSIPDGEGAFVIYRLPAGRYEVRASLAASNQTPIEVTSLLTVESLAPQHLELELIVQAARVRLHVPPDSVPGAILVTMTSLDIPETNQRTLPVQGTVNASDDGRQLEALFISLAPGRYRLVVRVFHGRHLPGNYTASAVKYAATREVHYDGDTDLEVTLNGNVGSLQIEVAASPALDGVFGFGQQSFGGGPLPPLARVWFRDAEGRAVEIGDDSFATFGLRDGGTVPAVPVGRYRMLLAGHGLISETMDVEVRKGEQTQVVATPSPAAVMRLRLNGITLAHLSEGGHRIRFENSDGEEVRNLTPDERIIYLRTSDGNGLTLSILNIEPQVQQVRIIIDGFEDTIIKTEPKPGRTIIAERTPTPNDPG